MSSFSSGIQKFLSAPDDARRLGPYRCREVLDKLGSAPVFRADEEHAGLTVRVVALKLFDIGKGKRGSSVVDEARALCRVQHPNVIRFHALATDEARGLMGLVMEFAEGVDVDDELDRLPQGDPRRVALAVEVGIDVASALAAAHAAGVVHANVKPSNILLSGGTHKLINFGLASAARGPASERPSKDRRAELLLADLPPDSIGRKAQALLKAEGDSATPLVGTIGYTDPICVRTTAPPAQTSDLYSLGATLYQCLSGDVPAVATARQKGALGVDSGVIVGDDDAAPIAGVAPSTPAELAKLVDALVSPTREARPRSAELVVHALERIRSALAGHERALPPEKRGPFPGLDRYGASDRDVFFGRSADIAAVTELCRTRGLVAVVGLSGSGKSSLTRAGVVPAIEDGALGGWPKRYRSALVTPGADPMGALRAALSKLLGSPLAEHPAEIVQQLSASVDETSEGIVLLVDQLEEIVIAHDDERAKSRLDALDLLSRLAEAPVGLRAIVVARRDLLDEILAIDPQFTRALSRGIQLVGPLSSAAWGEVLDRSLEVYGYRFEDDELRQSVLADLKRHESAMPLAQFGLTRLWAGRDAEKKTIGARAFDEEGGMRGALEHHAEKAVAALGVPKDKLRDVLLALTTPDGARAHAKRDDLAERFGDDGKKVVKALTSARLAVVESAGVTFVHDSILHEWKRLRGWIDGARDDRTLAAQLERDAARWASSRDPADLWRQGRLAASVELWKAKTVPLSDAAREFVHASAKEEKKARLVVRTLLGLVVFLMVGGSLLFAQQATARAAQARRDADALAAALEEVKSLKRQTDEYAMEAAATAEIIADLQAKMAAGQVAYGKEVQAAVKKVAAAKDLDSAQKAAADLKAPAGPQTQMVPLPSGLPTGPKPDVRGPSASSPDTGTFDQAAIERVVSSRKSGVKRRCLERGDPSASSTKVTATITIAPSGAVQSVTAAGNDADVARCIESQLRTWSFPPPGEVKQVQIPFVFVRQ